MVWYPLPLVSKGITSLSPFTTCYLLTHPSLPDTLSPFTVTYIPFLPSSARLSVRFNNSLFLIHFLPPFTTYYTLLLPLLSRFRLWVTLSLSFLFLQDSLCLMLSLSLSLPPYVLPHSLLFSLYNLLHFPSPFLSSRPITISLSPSPPGSAWARKRLPRHVVPEPTDPGPTLPPVFDPLMPTNVTVTATKTAVLACVVHNLGSNTVMMLAWFCFSFLGFKCFYGFPFFRTFFFFFFSISLFFFLLFFASCLSYLFFQSLLPSLSEFC